MSSFSNPSDANRLARPSAPMVKPAAETDKLIDQILQPATTPPKPNRLRRRHLSDLRVAQLLQQVRAHQPDGRATHKGNNRAPNPSHVRARSASG